MSDDQICPYYRLDEDVCDVGFGHISPHDVRTMVAFCRCRFEGCSQYQSLAARNPWPQRAAGVNSRSERTPAAPRAAMSPKPGKPLVRPFKARWPLPFQMRYIAMQYTGSPIHLKEERTMKSTQSSKQQGWSVVLAGTGINLALGVLYAWSIFKGAITDSIAKGGEGAFNWDPASVNDPYAVACLVFAVAMIVAGKIQDKFGPRLTCMLGGLLVGAGFIVSAQSTEYWSWVLGFGVLSGAGIGFGYSAATPPALKWFPPAKTGLVAGIVVSGFGLASVYIAPLAKYLLVTRGLQQSMMLFGIAFAILVSALAMFIRNPPAGYVAGASAGAAKAKSAAAVNLTPMQVLGTGKFYTLWAIFFIGAGAGLMVIGSVAGMAKQSLGELAFLAVAIMAVGNAAGRIVAGIVSDKIGRANTLTIMLLFQAALMFAAMFVVGGNSSAVMLVVLATFIGFNYGTNLSLFPSLTKDLWGLQNFGMNYGILFSAWGVGAFVLVRVSEMLKASSGSFTSSFLAAGVLLIAGAMLTMTLRERKPVLVLKPATVQEFDEDELAVKLD